MAFRAHTKRCDGQNESSTHSECARELSHCFSLLSLNMRVMYSFFVCMNSLNSHLYSFTVSPIRLSSAQYFIFSYLIFDFVTFCKYNLHLCTNEHGGAVIRVLYGSLVSNCLTIKTFYFVYTTPLHMWMACVAKKKPKEMLSNSINCVLFFFLIL